jgi:hypothetical protein
MDINLLQHFFAFLAVFAVKNVFAVGSKVEREYG